MAQQFINVGTVPNDGTGDALRIAFGKCNGNFNDLYASVGAVTIPNNTLYGNISGGPGVGTGLTAAQVTANFVNTFTPVLSGGVPASGGGTVNFLRADGTWHAAGAASPLTTKGDIYGFDTGNNRIPVGADGALLTAASSQALGVQWVTPPTPGLACKVTIFDQTTGGNTQTWTKAAGTVYLKVICIGGGGGGGSGAKQASGTAAGGGGAGGGGGVSYVELLGALLPATVNVTFSNTATGGNGAPSVSANSTNGTTGTAGSSAAFGVYINAPGGNPGGGGSSAAGGTAGSTGQGMWQQGTPGGSSGGQIGNAGGNLGVGPNGTNVAGPTGGGGGGGVNAAGTAGGGGNGGGNAAWSTITPGTSTAANTGGTAGNGSAGNGLWYLAAGGGGGGGATTAAVNGTTGGNGGKYGGGGGGGGGCLNTAGNSGAGGVGGGAVCIVVEF